METVCDIAQLGDPVLRQVAEPISDIFAPETQNLINALQTALAGTQGVGLAAPQIGVSQRVVIVASRPTARYPYAPPMAPTVMINPRYETLSDDKEKGWEGCLSVPSLRALVPRYTRILAHYTDAQGETVDLPLEGFTARVFQHEYDHLDGFVFLDRVEDTREIVAESEYFKRLNV